MGEIGLPRRECLYELDHADLILISRGYIRRQRSSWEQTRWIAYHVRYCMGLKQGETAPRIQNWVPFSWDNEENSDIPTEEEAEEMYDELIAFSQNAQSKQ